MKDNPFRYGALALDESFTNRERELAELRRDIINGQDVVLFGRRRFGKSSLILRVSTCRGPRASPASLRLPAQGPRARPKMRPSFG